MRKYIILVIVVVFMVGCNDKVSTLEKENPAVEQVEDIYHLSNVEYFTKEYNERVDLLNNENNEIPEMDKIDLEKVGKLEEVEGGYNQILYESVFHEEHGVYKVSVKFDEYNNVIGYELYSMGHPDNIDDYGNPFYSDKGIVSIRIIADLLGLDMEKFNQTEDKSYDDFMTSYHDEEYFIHIINSPELGSIYVNFDKLE